MEAPVVGNQRIIIKGVHQTGKSFQGDLVSSCQFCSKTLLLVTRSLCPEG